MTRPTIDSWNFVKVGETYQYKEDSLIAMVKILEDNSDEERYAFKLQILQSNMDMTGNLVFDISHIKDIPGIYSGMMQLYENPEYIPLPVGSPWPHDYE